MTHTPASTPAWPSLWPLSVFFILLAPSLLVLIYGFDQLDFDRLKIYFIWAVLFSSLSLLLGRFVLLTLACLFILIGIVELLHLLTLKALISQASMYVIFETNLSEAQDYISMSLSWLSLSVALFYVAVAVWILKRDLKLIKHTYRRCSRSKPTLVSGVLLALVVSYAAQGKLVDILPPTISSAIHYSQEIKAYKQIASQTKFRLKRLRTQVVDNQPGQVHVIVIGESSNRNHFSLYGYPRPTNPLLSKKADELLIYQDVISPFSHTLPVLRTALTLLRQKSQLEFYQAHSLIDFSRAAGYEVSWLSNQLPIGAWDNMISIMAHTADKTTFVNYADSSERASHQASYDAKLLPLLSSTLKQPAANKVIIMHLMGTHGVYKKRYPAAFNFFQQASNQQQTTINEYDNAVRYNDFIINAVIEQLQQYSANHPKAILSMTYFSDHGEEVYDSQDFIGHDWNRLSRHHVEIPFIVWLSDSYKQRYADKYKQMQQNTQNAYVNDDFTHSFLDLTDIQTPHKQLEKSVFSQVLKPRQRMVYKKNYDTELKLKRP